MTQQAKIVHIEDDEDLVGLVKVILRGRYELASALTGEEGIKLIQQVKPDLVLLDLMLPDMNGLEVCERLQADEQTCHIPVIIVSAWADHRNHQERPACEAGRLAKPFVPSTLLRSVREVLEAK